jgi:hypothetical protein
MLGEEHGDESARDDGTRGDGARRVALAAQRASAHLVEATAHMGAIGCRLGPEEGRWTMMRLE